VDVTQLLRVLRAAGASVPEALELKLNQLSSRGQTAATGTPPAAPKPFLTVSAKGQVLDIQQDLPISTPLRPSGEYPRSSFGSVKALPLQTLTISSTVLCRDRQHHC